ncbi:MAG: ATPase F0F1 [Bacteroidetes bacterium]|nr:ATPase F0F1 [Bacteroidota bacterium]
MDKPNNNLLWKYAGLATQFLVGIGLAVYAGIKLDEWLKLKTPLAVWVLPLLLITGVIVKIIKDTAAKK